MFSAATFRYVQQPYFLQVWFVGGKIRNIAFQLVLPQCCKTIRQFLLPIFPYFKLCLNFYVRFSCLLYQKKNSLKHSRQTTHYLVLLICFNFLYQQRPVLMMRTATVNQKWLLILFRYGHHCKAYLYANLAKQVKPLKATVNQSFSLISHVL